MLAETAAAASPHIEGAEERDTSLALAAVTRGRTDSGGVEVVAVAEGDLAEVTGATGQ